MSANHVQKVAAFVVAAGAGTFLVGQSHEVMAIAGVVFVIILIVFKDYLIPSEPFIKDELMILLKENSPPLDKVKVDGFYLEANYFLALMQFIA